MFGLALPSSASIIIALVSGALLLFGGWEIRGWKDDAAQLAVRNAQIEAQRQAVEEAQALQAADDAILIDIGKQTIVYREQVDTKTIYLTRKVTEYVTPKSVAACVVPRGFVELHNDSADAAKSATAISAPAAGTVDAPSGVGLDTVGATIASNYGVCNKALDLTNVEWPAWYAKVKAAYDEWAKKQR